MNCFLEALSLTDEQVLEALSLYVQSLGYDIDAVEGWEINDNDGQCVAFSSSGVCSSMTIFCRT